MVALLAGFGAVTGDADRPVITPLGRWAVHRLEDALPGAADPEISAAELIAEVAEYDDAAQRLEAASEWLEQHHPREILEAAESMPPLLRTVAADLVGMLGEYAIPAWREFTAAPHVGPHARYAVYAWDHGPEPDEKDIQWLATESAAAALDAKGPALCVVWESVRGEDLAARLAVVRATGHPATGNLARTLTGFTASGVPRSIDQGVQLKVTLKRGKPAIWRSVRLPVIATLSDLHQVIQLLFGWDGDHLHAFQVGRRTYSDPSFTPEDAADEDGIRLRDACRPGSRLGTSTTSGQAGSTRSRRRRPSCSTRTSRTQPAWRTRATPRSSTHPRRTRRNPSRSTSPKSTASSPSSADEPDAADPGAGRGQATAGRPGRSYDEPEASRRARTASCRSR
jgi:hypothetical protein